MKGFAIKLALTFTLIIMIYFALAHFGLLPDYLNVMKKFERKELSIEPTSVILDNVTSLAQLFTSTYYSEMPITEKKQTETMMGLIKKDHMLTIIAKGTCFAGTDLSKLTKDDIIFRGKDSCVIQLPKAEIIDIVMNPSDFDIYTEEGEWSPQEVLAVKEKGKNQLKDLAIKSDILQKANDRSVQMFTDFIKTLGYKSVEVKIKN